MVSEWERGRGRGIHMVSEWERGRGILMVSTVSMVLFLLYT